MGEQRVSKGASAYFIISSRLSEQSQKSPGGPLKVNFHETKTIQGACIKDSLM